MPIPPAQRAATADAAEQDLLARSQAAQGGGSTAGSESTASSQSQFGNPVTCRIVKKIVPLCAGAIIRQSPCTTPTYLVHLFNKKVTRLKKRVQSCYPGTLRMEDFCGCLTCSAPFLTERPRYFHLMNFQSSSVACYEIFDKFFCCHILFFMPPWQDQAHILPASFQGCPTSSA